MSDNQTQRERCNDCGCELVFASPDNHFQAEQYECPLCKLHDRIATLEADNAKLWEECDLAVAHDSQPYPTADAYEKVCKALEKMRNDEASVCPEDVGFVEYIKSLQAVVDKLPKTADGVPIVPPTVLYLPGEAPNGGPLGIVVTGTDGEQIITETRGHVRPKWYYSTRGAAEHAAAAEAARAAEGGED